jgi:PAS domain S-box-containing protein
MQAGMGRMGVRANILSVTILAVVGAGCGLAGAMMTIAYTTPGERFFGIGFCLLVLFATGVVTLRTHVARTAVPKSAVERSYRDFFDHAIDGIFRTTPDGQYLDANAALAQIYGYDSPQALMDGLTDIGGQLYLDPSRRPQFLAEMQANGKVIGFVSQIRRHDGAIIWISENSRGVRNWTGRIVFYEGTVEDVTQKIETAEALKRALRESEEASRAKSAFLAAMSHELKTPLNAVLGFSEILKEEMLGPLGKTAYRDYAVDIHSSGTRLLSIVNDILDMARLQGGAITLSSRPIAVSELADTALALARKSTAGDHAVDFAIPANLPEIDIDPARIAQALSNLLSNALKFTPGAGKIRVSGRMTGDGGMMITVSDTGIGMDSTKIAAALEPFRQLDGSLARRFEGTGLGLSIAKSIAELHGGKLSLESTPGKGTTATLLLPAARIVARELVIAV